MPAPYHGGCQCGRIRFTVAVAPDTLYICHCRECQKQSASAFGMSMTVPADSVTVTQGTPAQFTRQADSGNEVRCLFCPACGTRLFHETTGRPGKTNVKSGALDDGVDLAPVAHIWTASAQPWFAVPNGVLAFERQPPSHQILIDAYRSKGAH